MAQEVEFTSSDRDRLRRVVSDVDLRMLGPIEVLDGTGEALKLPGARPRGLLALLALQAPSVIATDSIVEALWGDEDVAKPEAALHMAVSRLRSALGEDVIATQPGGYRLDLPSTNTDLSRFRDGVTRGFTADECSAYRIDPCTTLNENQSG